MFAACSDSLDDNRTENGGTTLTTGDGYVKVAINLPTTSGMSRVNDDNMLDDGLEGEYAVENGIIAFLKLLLPEILMPVRHSSKLMT